MHRAQTPTAAATPAEVPSEEMENLMNEKDMKEVKDLQEQDQRQEEVCKSWKRSWAAWRAANLPAKGASASGSDAG
eukprot:6387154-Lingulodinium_polyedra.AAC.1